MQDRSEFLKAIAGDDIEARFLAWRAAASQDATVLSSLLDLAASSKPGVAKAAAEALTTMVHSVGKDTKDPRRAPLVKALLLRPKPLTFRLLSLIADDFYVPLIAHNLRSADLREEVVYCLERIPGTTADKALIAGYTEATNDFKPRILAALGHRKSADALPLCLEAMKSASPDIVWAATRAFGRIGKKAAVRFPQLDAWNEWQKTDALDAQLRYADAQAASGNSEEAMNIYKQFLDRPEEHWQCAAIVGFGRIATVEAATAIYPKLKSPNRKVQITARQIWQQLAKA